MTKPAALIVTAALTLASLVAPSPAFAQESARGELALGYSFLRDWDLEETFPVGWVASVGLHMNQWVTLVGDVSGHYKSLDVGFGEDLSLKEHAFLAGPRARYSWTSIGIYGQLLLGITHVSVGMKGVGFDVSDSGFTAQTGVGVDFDATPLTAIRFETGGRFIRGGDDTGSGNQWRVMFGVVRRIGR